IGQVDRSRLRDDSLEALFGLYFGPGGLPRDAAIASLQRLLADPKAVGPGGVGVPPLPRQRNWDTVVERWLVDHLAPDVEAVEPSAVEGRSEQVLAAWRHSMAGTRAEMNAASRAARSCGEEPVEDVDASRDPGRMCLEPLVAGTVELKGSPGKKRGTAKKKPR
ncbi:MAG: hypothetical protein KC457_26295, partial [Myxococcales bacterium]|nr:hypothetical protein [Myxococcales bacterium]